VTVGSLVLGLLSERDVRGWHVLDLGCGEGKNAAALSKAGANVTAVDCSDLAIAHSRKTFGDLPIKWLVADAGAFPMRKDYYDLVIMYGVLHCLPSAIHISALIANVLGATRRFGLHLVVALNDRDQDLERAHPGFKPTLVPHKFYVDAYGGQRLLRATDTNLRESHPNNKIEHHHSVTRLVAEIR
jgi:tellurite methyltransferase